MRKTGRSASVGIIFFACVLGVVSQACAQPECILEAESIDFGTVSTEQENARVLTIRNEGDSTLKITSVKSSCPCLKPEVAEKALAPDAQTELKVKLDLATYPTNEISGSVILETNDPSKDLVQVRVTGKIQPELTVEPNPIDFGTVKRGLAHTMTATVFQHTQSDLLITDIQSPPGLTCSVKKLESDNAKPPKATYTLEVTLDPSLRQDILNEKITLNTSIARIPKWSVPVRARFIGIECTITPGLIAFGPSEPGEAIGTIDITGSDALDIIEAECTVDGISIKVGKKAAGMLTATLALDSDITPGTKVGRVRLHLKENHLIETRDISLYGTVAQPK